jgi:hypothetical protein
LSQLSFTEQGLSFNVISEESVEPILAAFKKVTYYENIETIDPRERENIISVIANLDYEVSYQNAMNILLMARGIKAGEAKQILDSEMLIDIEQVKDRRRLEGPKPTDLKRLINNPEEQNNEAKAMITSKKPSVSEAQIKSAQDSLI